MMQPRGSLDRQYSQSVRAATCWDWGQGELGDTLICTKCEKRGLPLPVLLGVGWEVPVGPGMGEKAKHVLGVIPELLLQREQCCLQAKEGSGRSLQLRGRRGINEPEHL